jgi:hypothetical protein
MSSLSGGPWKYASNRLIQGSFELAGTGKLS